MLIASWHFAFVSTSSINSQVNSCNPLSGIAHQKHHTISNFDGVTTAFHHKHIRKRLEHFGCVTGSQG